MTAINEGFEVGQLKFEIAVDREGCIACATCYTIDPVHFESDSEGKSKVVGGTSNGRSTGSFDDGNVADAKSAAESCPVSVIRVSET
jgi:ferredoxin